MDHIGETLAKREKDIELVTKDPVVRGGFTQVPNFILEKDDLSAGAKVTYAMFLKYAWYNDCCFPGQERLAKDMGCSRSRVSEYIGELQRASLVTITRRGLGKTNLYKIHFVVQKRTKRG
jgi:hypothetical protein